MHWQADGLGLIGQRALDGLLDPPGSIRGKLAAFAGIESLDGFHQPNVAFADQIQQRQADAFIVPRNFYDQPKVGFDHLLSRLFVAVLDSRSEFDFLLRRQQLYLSDFAKIELEGRASIIGGSLWWKIRFTTGSGFFACIVC